MHITRPQWRDALKDDEGLTEHEKFIGLLVADYWKADSVEPVWAAAEVLMRQSGLSRTMVFRALKGLRTKGYLNEVEKARPNRSPRWLPTVPEATQCLTDTAQGPTDTEQCPEDHRNPTHTPSTPDDGSNDQDFESRPPFGGREMTSIQQADRRKLASFMTNYAEESTDRVYWWMRDGISPAGHRASPIDRPGAYAARKGKVASDVPGLNSWQGFFNRHFVKDKNIAGAPTTAATADPWATSKSA